MNLANRFLHSVFQTTPLSHWRTCHSFGSYVIICHMAFNLAAHLLGDGLLFDTSLVIGHLCCSREKRKEQSTSMWHFLRTNSQHPDPTSSIPLSQQPPEIITETVQAHSVSLRIFKMKENGYLESQVSERV